MQKEVTIFAPQVERRKLRDRESAVELGMELLLPDFQLFGLSVEVMMLSGLFSA